MPTAIIVPNVEPATQWREALTKFLDGPTIGQYGGNSKKLSGDIDIVTAQSISRTDSRTDFLTDYGYIIIDECHRVGAAGLTRVLADLSVRFINGLTATPYRSDGLDALLPMICGPFRHTMELEHAGPKHYVVQTTEFTYDEPHLYRSDLDNALAADSARHALITETITRATTNGKNVLVLVKRREHISSLETLLTRDHPDLTVPFFTLHGAQSSKDRKATRKALDSTPHFILIAMTQIAGEGGTSQLLTPSSSLLLSRSKAASSSRSVASPAIQKPLPRSSISTTIMSLRSPLHSVNAARSFASRALCSRRARFSVPSQVTELFTHTSMGSCYHCIVIPTVRC